MKLDAKWIDDDMSKIDPFMERLHITKEEWCNKWINEIPYLHFDADWEVKFIPPYDGMLASFIIKKGDSIACVYFIGYTQYGYMCDANDNPIPFFEVCPSPDVLTYCINETEEMLNDIRAILNG